MVFGGFCATLAPFGGGRCFGNLQVDHDINERSKDSKVQRWRACVVRYGTHTYLDESLGHSRLGTSLSAFSVCMACRRANENRDNYNEMFSVQCWGSNGRPLGQLRTNQTVFSTHEYISKHSPPITEDFETPANDFAVPPPSAPPTTCTLPGRYTLPHTGNNSCTKIGAFPQTDERTLFFAQTAFSAV